MDFTLINMAATSLCPSIVAIINGVKQFCPFDELILALAFTRLDTAAISPSLQARYSGVKPSGVLTSNVAPAIKYNDCTSRSVQKVPKDQMRISPTKYWIYNEVKSPTVLHILWSISPFIKASSKF